PVPSRTLRRTAAGEVRHRYRVYEEVAIAPPKPPELTIIDSDHVQHSSNARHHNQEQVSRLDLSHLRGPVVADRNAGPEGQVTDAGLPLRPDGHHVTSRGEFGQWDDAPSNLAYPVDQTVIYAAVLTAAIESSRQ